MNKSGCKSREKDRLCVEIVGQNLDLCEAGELADNQ